MEKLRQSHKDERDQWLDVSLALKDRMVNWPGDPPVNIRRVQDIDRGDSLSLSLISMGSHSGTHVDSPSHFLKHAATVDQLPLNTLIGIARVIKISDHESIKIEELALHAIHKGERILLKTGNSELWQREDNFTEDFIALSPGAARYLAEREIRLLGIDYLSVGGYHSDGGEVHRTLLEAGIVIVEGLDLSEIAGGRYHFLCLPLRLEGGDGAPARVLLKGPISSR